MKAAPKRDAWVRVEADVNGGLAFGKVIASGPRTFTVRWESGVRNRFPVGDWRVTLVTDQELVAELERDQKKLLTNG